MNNPTKLMFMCGKMAAGKSTLARDLAERGNAILLVQDELLARITAWTTDAEFEAITPYFQPPTDDEAYNVVRHERS